MRRRRIAILAVVGLASAGVVGHAELDGDAFESADHNLRVAVPRGWRAADQPTYPGVLLWMRRTRPPGMMVVTSATVDAATYCGWPAACRRDEEELGAQRACALGAELAEDGFTVGALQPGPLVDGVQPSWWYDVDDGRRWLRHGFVANGDRIHAVVLSSPTAAARDAHVRAFEQVLRSMRPLEEATDGDDDDEDDRGDAVGDDGPGAPGDPAIRPGRGLVCP